MNREAVTFEVEFLIEGINDIGIFSLRSFKSHEEEVKKVTETLKKDIKSKFQIIPTNSLMAKDVDTSTKLQKIAKFSHQKIAKIFGLDIMIITIKSKNLKLKPSRHLAIAV